MWGLKNLTLYDCFRNDKNVDKKMNWVGFVFNGFILTNYYVQMSYERIEYDIDNFVSICDWM